MRKYLVGLFIVVILAALYLLYGVEQTVSLSEFKNELTTARKISVVVDMRSTPVAGTMINCGVALVENLETQGISTNYFFYDEQGCSYGSLKTSSKNASIKECESKLVNSIVLYIRYNPNRNQTSFYKSKAVVEGDSDFLSDCAIARMIG